MEGKRPETCRRAPNLFQGRMDKIQVTTPTGRQLSVRLSTLSGVENKYDSWNGHRYYIKYKSGRRLQVERDSADRVFDALSPKLF